MSNDKYDIVISNLSDENIISKKKINELEQKISTEKTERVIEDNNQSQKISNESINRAKADSKLSIRISKEISDRKESHSGLKDDINKLDKRVDNLEENVGTNNHNHDIKFFKQQDLNTKTFTVSITNEKLKSIETEILDLDCTKFRRVIDGECLTFLNTIKNNQAGYQEALNLKTFYKISSHNSVSDTNIEEIFKKYKLNYSIDYEPEDAFKMDPAIDPTDESQYLFSRCS